LRSVEKHLSEISTINKTNNTEHGEENVQMKTHAYVHRWDEWIKFNWRNLVRL